MSRPRLLDLFCGAGGAAMGYHRAGFDVVGVDIAPQPHYPFEFYQRDVTEIMKTEIEQRWITDRFDAIHASPPCQAYSTLASMNNARRHEYVDLYGSTRDLLEETGLPWIVENVIGAPYRSGFVLCGSMFRMKVRRHRNFECSFAVLMDRGCDHRSQGRVYGVYGDGGGGQQNRGYKGKPSEFRGLMDMPWATPREITQAIPPAYAEFIGRQLLQHLRVAA